MNLTAQDVKAMVEDWLDTDPNTIFGNSYGADKAQLLFKPLSAPIADNFLDKLRRDIPLLATLSADQLSIEAETQGMSVKRLYLRIGQIYIDMGQPTNNSSGETSRVNTF